MKALLAVMVALIGVVALAQQPEPIAYPAKGQSASQQDKDQDECVQWSRKKSGFDPASAASAPSTSGAAQAGAAAPAFPRPPHCRRFRDFRACRFRRKRRRAPRWTRRARTSNRRSVSSSSTARARGSAPPMRAHSPHAWKPGATSSSDRAINERIDAASQGAAPLAGDILLSACSRHEVEP